jgi:threo-3-hydroxy-L-aspartate ammonia-lyase
MSATTHTHETQIYETQIYETQREDTGLEALGRADVLPAQRLLTGRIVRTPAVRSEELDRLAGARVWLKAENLQRGGSFKLRGALLAVGRMAGDGTPGVIAQSTGNHAIAVALAARDCGLPAVLVLPPDVVGGKADAVRAAGGELVLDGRTPAERAGVVERLRAERGWAVVDPWEDPDVVAGQSTAAAELIDQVWCAGGALDTIVAPVGGGSLLAGVCLASAGLGIDVVGAEPAAVPALTEALRAGRPVAVPVGTTIADGLRPDTIGRLPFEICRTAVSRVITVDELAIADALCLALFCVRLLVEPASATALAGALALLAETGNNVRDVGVVLTGGNVDPALAARLLAERNRRAGVSAGAA